MTTLAVIAIFTFAVLLPATLVAGGRKAARPRTPRAPRSFDDDAVPCRSHAEASRRSGGS